MLLSAVLLDANMTAEQALVRLAANGFWLDRTSAAAAVRLASLELASDDPRVELLERDPERFGAAIRRQWGTRVLWYARALSEVLSRCSACPPDARLVDALNLHEGDSVPPVESEVTRSVPPGGVLLDGGMPIAVALSDDSPMAAEPVSRGADPVLRSHTDRAVPPTDSQSRPATCWPRLDAPAAVAARQAFEVRVGFSASRQAGTAGGAITLPFTPQTPALDVTIELSAGREVRVIGEWSQTIQVTADTIETAEAVFILVGQEPTTSERAWLTTLQVRYVMAGTVCGIASRPLVILAADNTTGPVALPHGAAWTQVPPASSPVSFVADPLAPDLTVELFKSDGDATSGRYECRLLSPHALTTRLGPFNVDLGQDARSMARQLVDDLRGNAALTHLTLKGFGKMVSDRLPQEFFDALAEVNRIVQPEVPSVLIVSQDHYVPWELAWIDPPLDPGQPRFLGAQAVVGRWLRNGASPDPDRRSTRPPAVHPQATMSVKRMAVMAGWYKDVDGLRRLEHAEKEARTLVDANGGLALPARAESLRDLLGDQLREGFANVQVDAIHFAGHGVYDPLVPGAWVLYLEDGSVVQSSLFRAADYGGDRQPLLFLNACMLGIGGETIGDMAGFPGHSLRGGFGAVLGALWEIDDKVAHDIAIEFWSRALPTGPGTGEPIGRILRDLRARYVPDARPAPVSTYLSYVYYGHPRLALQRA